MYTAKGMGSPSDIYGGYLRAGIGGDDLKDQEEYESLESPSEFESMMNQSMLSSAAISAMKSLATKGVMRGIMGYRALGELPKMGQILDPVTLSGSPRDFAKGLGKRAASPGMRGPMQTAGSLLGGIVGSLAGPLGTFGGSILGRIGGEGIADLFNMRENEELEDYFEDMFGWWNRHRYNEMMRDPRIAQKVNELQNTLGYEPGYNPSFAPDPTPSPLENFMDYTPGYNYDPSNLQDLEPFDFGGYNDVMDAPGIGEGDGLGNVGDFGGYDSGGYADNFGADLDDFGYGGSFGGDLGGLGGLGGSDPGTSTW